MKSEEPKQKPWKRKNPTPKKARTKLTPASIAAAKKAAAKAGRKYPNLIDNMQAAMKQRQGK